MPTVTHPEPGNNADAVRVTEDRLTDWESRRSSFTIVNFSYVLVGLSGQLLASDSQLFIDGVLTSAIATGSFNVADTSPVFFLYGGLPQGWHKIAPGGTFVLVVPV